MKNEKFIELFKDEALELLGNLEDNLLMLEQYPEDNEQISAVFRVMHTIKGSAGMFGLKQISEFSHEVESILDELREGKISVSRELINYTLTARDYILSMMEQSFAPNEGLPEELTDFLCRFKADICQNNYSRLKGIPDGLSVFSVDEQSDGEEMLYRIFFKPFREIFHTGTNPLLVLRELTALGENLLLADIERVPGLSEIDPESCYIGWELYVATKIPINKIRDIFIFIDDKAEIKIEPLESSFREDGDNYKKIGEILVERGSINKSTLDRVLKSRKKLGDVLVDENIVSRCEINSALKEQKYIKKVNEKRSEINSDSIRVKSGKLDKIMDLVGELVTVYARIARISSSLASSELSAMVERFGRLTDELRDNTMDVRMLPIGSTFGRFRRLVRDLSGQLGKDVHILTLGAETEIDKTVIEKLNDPLVHIIRNCIDHGIEDPETRKRKGKSGFGQITLSAVHAGASVLISVEDDGRGLNKDVIRKKAVERGLITEGDELEEAEIFDLLFAPGFSTAENVTNVSGRGVGMDVVIRNIKLLNGSISIESEFDKYTRINLTLPLTMAIIDGLHVRVEEEDFIIPLPTVEACVELTAQERAANAERQVITFRGEMLPYIDLRRVFSIKGEHKKIEQIVIVNTKEMRVGLIVDQVIGSNQAVIKSLGSVYKNAEGVSGASILGNGAVSLVLDVEEIVGIAKDEIEQ